MVMHYTMGNAGAFAKNHGLTEEQAELIICYMEGHGYHLFDYDTDDECRMPDKEYPTQLYRLEVNEFAYKRKTDYTAVKREPLYIFDGFLDEYSVSEAVMTVREWIWSMMDDEEYENELQRLEADEDKLAAVLFA